MWHYIERKHTSATVQQISSEGQVRVLWLSLLDILPISIILPKNSPCMLIGKFSVDAGIVLPYNGACQ